MSIRYEKGYEMDSGHILTESEAQLLNDVENLCSLIINSRASINDETCRILRKSGSENWLFTFEFDPDILPLFHQTKGG